MKHGPYSPFAKAGNLTFISGQVGINSNTKQCAKQIEAQTIQALKNLEGVLANASLKLDNLVKITVFLADMNDFGKMNLVYEKFFNQITSKPARSTVAVKELPKLSDKPLLIEIEAVAYKKQGESDA